MDKREQARAAAETLPLSKQQLERALAGVEAMSEEELDSVLGQYARIMELLPRVLRRDGDVEAVEPTAS